MDHSMATSFEAVRGILAGSTDKTAVWGVNTDKAYHEEKSAEVQEEMAPTPTSDTDTDTKKKEYQPPITIEVKPKQNKGEKSGDVGDERKGS